MREQEPRYDIDLSSQTGDHHAFNFTLGHRHSTSNHHSALAVYRPQLRNAARCCLCQLRAASGASPPRLSGPNIVDRIIRV